MVPVALVLRMSIITNPMKVVLMQPLKGFVREPPNIPDIGLGYIATSLKKNGHLVHILDWNMKLTVKDFKKWLKEIQPDVIGIKIFTKDVGAAKRTISLVRETLPDGIIVIGGPHPSAVDPLELMEDFGECDFAIKGEAEASLSYLRPLIATERRNNRKYYWVTYVLILSR
jgi:anaerobic magnesium-protoporphyrin IX monomethyl ester cyclase